MVVYFSAKGYTQAVARTIAETLHADLYEMIRAKRYTYDDLNWNHDSSRGSLVHKDPAMRSSLAEEAIDLSGYDTVFIGYPIWWGEAPHIVWNFSEISDLANKKVIPLPLPPPVVSAPVGIR